MSSILGKTCSVEVSGGESTEGLHVSDLQRELAGICENGTEGLEEPQETAGMEEEHTEGLMDTEEHTEGFEDESAPPLTSSFSYQPQTGALNYPPRGLYSVSDSYSFAPVPTNGMGYVKPTSFEDTPSTSGLGYVNPNRSSFNSSAASGLGRPMYDMEVPVTRGLRQPLLAPSSGCLCNDCKSGKGHSRHSKGHD